MNRSASSQEISAQEERMLEMAKAGMSNEEASFDVEEKIDQNLRWADKFKPQKPKYFNRVQTGYEWTKYNQTHYSTEEPPPKIVQGYRFNIFYPDLLDVTKTPRFELYECPNDDEFAILRFKGGPPYEDIAFKIVNKDWDTNHKSGYKCQFADNVLQLHFYFKKLRYRR